MVGGSATFLVFESLLTHLNLNLHFEIYLLNLHFEISLLNLHFEISLLNFKKINLCFD